MRKPLHRIIASLLSACLLISVTPAQINATEIKEDTVEVSDGFNETGEVVPEETEEINSVRDDDVKISADGIGSDDEIVQETVPVESNVDGKDIVDETLDPEKADKEDSAEELELVSVKRDGGEAYFTEMEVVFPDDYDRIIDNIKEEVPYDESELMSSGRSYWDKFSCNYFYDQMTYEEQNLYDQLYTINNTILTTDVDVSVDPQYTGGVKYNDDNYYDVARTNNLSTPAMLKVVRIFRLENPQFYFLNTSVIYGGNYVAVGVYDKFVNGEERAGCTAYIKDTIEEWYDGIPKGATDLAKEVYIQNKIVDSIIYDPRVASGGDPDDEQSRYNQSCYSILGDNTEYTVCAGYAQAFALLMNGLDIDTVSITSYSHEWNKIKLYGRWYLTDVTWDDTGTNGSYRYTHFNISESRMESIDSYMSPYPGGSYNIDGNSVTFYNPKDHDEMTSFEGYNGEYTYLWPQDLPTAETNVGSDKESAYSEYNGYSGNTIAPVITSTASGDDYLIKITSGTSGASIYFVTYDESTEEPEEPSESYSKSRLYSGTFTVPGGTVVKAIACMDGYNDSAVTSLLAGTHSSSAANNVSSVTSVEISDSSKTVSKAESFRLRAYCKPTYASQSARNLYWFTSDPSVATIENSNASSEYVTVKGHKAGTATITANTNSNNSGTVKAQCVVTVSDSDVSINRIKVADQDGNTSSDINLKTQTSVSLSAQLNTGADGAGQLTWSCDNEAVTLTPSEDTLSCVAECDEVASATITATAGNGVKGSYNVSFYMPAEGLAFDKTDLYLEAPPDNSIYLYSLSVNILGDSTEVVSWSTTNTNIAYVYSYDESDAQHRTIRLACQNPGDTVLTASIPSGFSATCNIHVYDTPVESVSIVDSEGKTYTSESDYRSVPKGSEFVLRAAVTPNNADYPEVCDWSVWGYTPSNLKLTDNKDGTCTVKVLDGFSPGTSYTTYVKVQTYNYEYAYYYIHPYIPVTSVRVRDSSYNISSDRTVGDSFDVTASFNSDCDTSLADTNLTWESSDSSVATVTGYISGTTRKATIKAVGSGTAVITASTSNGISGTYTVNCSVKHTVTFNANGGSCSTRSKTYTDGEAYGTLPSPSRTGYDFVGWYTDAVAGDKVEPTDTVNKDITLYARWIKTVTVTYQKDGGTCSESSKKVTVGGAYGDLPVPTKTGYTFAGWFSESTGGTVITKDSSVTKTTNHDIYARWTANTYTVTFDVNGDDDICMCDTDSKTVTFDAGYGTLPTPLRTGYKFTGWYTEKSGNNKVTENTLYRVAGNQTLYAHWTPLTYIVNFYRNDGTTSKTSISVTYNSTYGANNDFSTATRTGYDFAGWYTEPAGGSPITAETVVKITSSQNLYAHWTANTYRVSFDGNGGTPSASSINVAYDSTYGENNDFPTATRTGYDFDGWHTSQTGGPAITSESIVSITEDQTLYAHWSGKRFNVTYDPNGGQISGTPTKTVTYGGTYGTPAIALRDGYTVEGWYTESTGGTKITPETNVEILANQTLYAHWTYGNYDLTLDANGGKFDNNNTTRIQPIVFGQPYGELDEPSRTGYTFEGWYTAPSGGTRISSASTVTATSNQTLYAHWTINSYTVTFDENYDDAQVSTETRQYKSAIGTFPKPERYLYDFDGWYTTPTGGEKITSQTVVMADVTYYAHWTKIPTFTVTFSDNYPGGGVTARDCRKGVAIGELPTPARTGYVFDGWYTAAKGGKEVTTSTIISESSTYYAKWTVAKYTVAFDPNQGVCTASPKTVTFDAKYGTLPTATRSGYTFAGWYTQASGGNPVTANTIVSQGVDHTLYAHWTPNTYVLTFDATGGVCPVETRNVIYEKTYGYTTGGNVTELPVPTKTGYDFDGWYKQESGGDKIMKDSVVSTAAKHTLYAHWKTKNYTVTFDRNDDVAYPANLTGSATMRVDYAGKYGALPTITRPQHGFLGWFTAKDGGIRVMADSAVTTANDHTLFARWEDWGEVLDEENKKDRENQTVESIAADTIWVRGVPESIPYTSTAIKFDDLRVYRSNKLLVKDRDYTISYKNNTNAGTATVIITGKGNYNGKREQTFTITSLDLGNVTDSGKAYATDISLTDTGKIQKGTTTAYYEFASGKTVTLRSGTDYYYAADAYNEVTAKPGNYTVNITGKGNYTGTLSFTEHVLAKNDTTYLIGKATIKSIPAQQATGNPIRFDGSDERRSLLEVSTGSGKNKQILEQGIHYSVEYQNNTLPGTATVVIKGKAPYSSGTKTATFKINATAISKSVANLSGLNPITNSATYTGAPICPELALTYVAKKGDLAETLSKWGKDAPTGSYSVDGYINNINAGKNKAMVQYSGHGSFTGTAKKTFTIDPVSLAATNEGDDDGKITIEVAGTPYLVNGHEYPFVKYQKGGTKPAIKITFHNRYATGWSEDYTLVEGKDYILSFKNNTVVNEAFADLKKIPTVTITGKGNFTGKNEKLFGITTGSLEHAVFVADDVVFKNKAGNFVTKLTVTDTSGKALAANTDYDKNVSYYYVDIPGGTAVTDKMGSAVSIIKYNPENPNPNEATVADAKNHIVPAGTTMIAVITGRNNFSGSEKTAEYRIVRNAISSVSLKIKDQIYTGRQINIGYDDIISIKAGKYNLVPGDYTIDNCYNNIEKGTGKIVLHGQGNYGGSKIVTFKIVNRTLNP